jgi:hypothetical protein
MLRTAPDFLAQAFLGPSGALAQGLYSSSKDVGVDFRPEPVFGCVLDPYGFDLVTGSGVVEFEPFVRHRVGSEQFDQLLVIRASGGFFRFVRAEIVSGAFVHENGFPGARLGRGYAFEPRGFARLRGPARLLRGLVQPAEIGPAAVERVAVDVPVIGSR